MAVKPSERARLIIAKNIPFSRAHSRESPCSKLALLSSPSSSSCDGCSEEEGHPATNLTGASPGISTLLLRMDEGSTYCPATGPMNGQTEATKARRFLSSEIIPISSAYSSAPSNQSVSFNSYRSLVDTDDTGSSTVSVSSGATHLSRGRRTSQGSENSQAEEDFSSSSFPLCNGKDTQASHSPASKTRKGSSAKGDLACTNNGAVDGNDGQPKRRPLSLTIERSSTYMPFLDSPMWNPSTNSARFSNVSVLLSEWNDSPFVSSYPNHHKQEETATDTWSSYGQPWHFDLQDVVIGDMVATGSYGMVFKGVYKEEKVAVKVLLIPEASSKDELNKLKANFVQEIDLWYTLSHPNIVQFVGAYVVPPRWAIVTEFLDGGSLRAYLLRQQRRKLPTATVYAMASDIARGMEYLHQNHIIHRDLKSANLLLDENGTVKVADFGLARFEAGDAGNLTAETGTIRWMAPEVICHMPYNRKIDVYSYGIVLWELCTTCVPYEGMSFVQLAHAVANDHHRPPTCDIQPSLVKLMKQCWDKDATKRPNFTEIVKYLEPGFGDGSKFSLRAGYKSARSEIKAPIDNYSRPTVSMRGGRVVGRTRNTGPSYGTNTDDALSDDEEWVSIRRQCRCVIL